jgi:hypothetical protein
MTGLTWIQKSLLMKLLQQFQDMKVIHFLFFVSILSATFLIYYYGRSFVTSSNNNPYVENIKKNPNHFERDPVLLVNPVAPPVEIKIEINEEIPRKEEIIPVPSNQLPEGRRKAIKEVSRLEFLILKWMQSMLHGWKGYEKYAFGYVIPR